MVNAELKATPAPTELLTAQTTVSGLLGLLVLRRRRLNDKYFSDLKVVSLDECPKTCPPAFDCRKGDFCTDIYQPCCGKHADGSYTEFSNLCNYQQAECKDSGDFVVFNYSSELCDQARFPSLFQD